MVGLQHPVTSIATITTGYISSQNTFCAPASVVSFLDMNLSLLKKTCTAFSRRMFMLLLPTAFAFVPVLKADIYKYEITSNSHSLNISFELTALENPANDITSVDGLTGTVDGFNITAFGISGDSLGFCDDGVPAAKTNGACWVATNANNQTDVIASPIFTGLGTKTSDDGNRTTVTITEIRTSPVPEPSGMVLLASALVAVGFVTRR
jgi:hypothetical protein